MIRLSDKVTAAYNHFMTQRQRPAAHTFRPSFVSHLLGANYDIHTIQQLSGASSLSDYP